MLSICTCTMVHMQLCWKLSYFGNMEKRNDYLLFSSLSKHLWEARLHSLVFYWAGSHLALHLPSLWVIIQLGSPTCAAGLLHKWDFPLPPFCNSCLHLNLLWRVWRHLEADWDRLQGQGEKGEVLLCPLAWSLIQYLSILQVKDVLFLCS